MLIFKSLSDCYFTFINKTIELKVMIIKTSGSCYVLSALFFILLLTPVSASAGTVAVYPAYSGNSIIDHILYKTEKKINKLFFKSGLYYPADYHSKKKSLEKAAGPDSEKYYENAARFINADIAVFFNLIHDKGIFKLSVKVLSFSLSEERVLLDTSVLSSIPDNIPLKAELKCAEFLKEIKLEAEVLDVNEGMVLIDAGQWNGLEIGEYETDMGTVYVSSVERYSSFIISKNILPGNRIVFEITPDFSDLIVETKKSIKSNIIKKFGTDEELNKRGSSAKELTYSTCIINPGASLLLPGYGSYLSLEYLGIKNTKPDWPGIALSAGLVLGHFTLPSLMTNFDVNFFPWVRDSDKTAGMQRLHIFLWASIPLTYTMSFLNQMAYQCHIQNILPPVFDEINSASAVISLFVPGGGLFYKGYRGAGYGFYAAEMSLLGYGLYSDGGTKRKALFSILAGVKVADIAFAWFLKPSYSVYRNEISSIESAPQFYLGMLPRIEGEGEFIFAVRQSF